MKVIKTAGRAIILLMVLNILASGDLIPIPQEKLSTQAITMQTTAAKFVGKLLCLVWKVTPYIMLAMFIVGAVIYVGGADDPAQKNTGKQMVLNAMIGGVCVILLIGVAEQVGVIMPEDCGLFS